MSSLDNMQFNNVLPSEYKLEEMPISMDAATEYEWHEIQSDNLNQPQGSNWRLQLKNLNVLVNPAKAYLEVRGRMTDDADVALVGNENCSIQNHILSLFSRATLRVGGQIVETINECHVAKGLVQPLLHYSQDYASSAATNEMFYKDTGDFTAATTRTPKYLHAAFNAADNVAANALAISENPAYNDGFAKRYLRTNGKNFTAWVPLSAIFGFCSVNRVLTNNTFIVELTRSNVRDHILSSTGAGKVAVGKVSIWMPNILPRSVVDLSLKSAFADGLTSDYVYPQMQAYSFTTTSAAVGASTDNLRIATSSEKVLYCFVILRNGARTIANSVAATSDTIATLELRLNGRAYPSQNYVSLEGDSDDKARAYSDALRYMSKGYDYSSGTPLSYDEWKLSTIYAFDMTSQPESFAGAPATIELKATSGAAGLVSREWSVCVMTEKRCQISYTGQSSVVLVN
jgi:hypothetical protein